MYEVTKRFTGGILAGVTITQRTSVAWTAGDIVTRGPFTPSPYIVTTVKELHA